MQHDETTVFFHADDYGITLEQAQRILGLSKACGGKGQLNSISIFVNSPCFRKAALLTKKPVEANKLSISLHLNLVEGAPVSNPCDVPLLVGERGTFDRDFLGLLVGSIGPHRTDLYKQLVMECRAQIRLFLSEFPFQHEALRIDSHQHTHAVPLVYRALAQALKEERCKLAHLREPLDPLRLYKASSKQANNRKKGPCGNQTAANKGKVLLINALWKRCNPDLMPWLSPEHRTAPLFCGIALSGQMSQFNPALLHAFQDEAARQNRDLEVLFHPVSVPLKNCLDPLNSAFAKACASAERDQEATLLQGLTLYR